MAHMPNRSDDLSPAGERKRKSRGTDQITKGELLPVTRIPEADPTWHQIAIDFYESLETSGQSAWYQDSDWMYAYSLCDDLSYYKKAPGGSRSSMMLTAIMSAMSNLLVTEGDRRRVRIELTAPEPEGDNAAVLTLASYKESLGVEA